MFILSEKGLTNLPSEGCRGYVNSKATVGNSYLQELASENAGVDPLCVNARVT